MTTFAGPGGAAALDMRVDVVSRLGDGQIWRTASYTNGDSWQQAWEVLADPPIDTVPGSGAGVVQQQEYGLAYAASGDGRTVHLCVRGKRLLPVQTKPFFYHCRSDNYTKSWTAWTPIGAGVFTSAPAMAVSGNGQKVIAVGRGGGNKIWYARSFNGGDTWNVAWKAIGSGVFDDYGPAVAVSADFSKIYVFGRGTDGRVWVAISRDGASTWESAWSAVRAGLINSAPAAAVSADGERLYVFGRGTDSAIYWSRSTDGGKTFNDWNEVPAGNNFNSSPAAVCSWDGMRVQVFALGGNRRIWRALSNNGTQSWPVAWAQVGSQTF